MSQAMPTGHRQYLAVRSIYFTSICLFENNREIPLLHLVLVVGLVGFLSFIKSNIIWLIYFRFSYGVYD